MKHKNLTLTAILAAMLCVLAPFSVPLGAIPLTLATLAVYLISCLSSVKQSASAVIIYILLGAVGLPVFSGFTGGFHQLAGLTGGYIIGYIPCTLIISFAINRHENLKLIYPLSMLVGTAICYFFGTMWYSVQADTELISSFAVCVIPFLFGDVLKIIVASLAGYTLRNRLSKFIR